MEKITIVIADDHPLFRGGVRAAIEKSDNFLIVGEASNGIEAMEIILKEKPDVAVLDINMPKLTGLQVAGELKLKNIKTEIVFLTMFDDEDILNEAMDLEVKAYILKDSAAIDIVSAVNAVHEGRNYLSPSLTYKLFSKKKTEDELLLVLKEFSESEIKVLKFLADFKSTKEIAEELSLSPRTVENYRYRLSEKLKLSGQYNLLKFAMEYKNQI